MKKFPWIRQLYSMDCGPTCLAIVARYHGSNIPVEQFRRLSNNGRTGTNLVGLSDAAEEIGFKTLSIRISFEKLRTSVPLPCIVYWKQYHFVVVYKINSKYVYVSDPAGGRMKYSHEEFKRGWINYNATSEETGIVLALETTPRFYEATPEETEKIGWMFFIRYLRPYRGFILQLLLSMMIGSLLVLVFPFLTQAIVDIGINTKDIGFINLILFAQLFLSLSRTVFDFIRGWILFHITSRLNIFILSDFIMKLFKLPLSFFDGRLTGDLLQRINDHRRVESFLTSQSLSFIFSLFNFVIFGLVLAYYNLSVFLVFAVGSLIYFVWIRLFFGWRKELDYKNFDESATNQTQLIQLVTAIQEIKLQGIEKAKRWEWERTRAKLFRISQKGLTLTQIEQVGSLFINEAKNILITIITAKSVIDGDITFGMMLSIQYITGQLNSPVMQMIGFVRSLQEAGYSLERLGEIHGMDDEENPDREAVLSLSRQELLQCRNIRFQDVHFAYDNTDVINGIDLDIPIGKKTAIVGMSGSGKTTLIKLILKFYRVRSGQLSLDNKNLDNIRAKQWRHLCGAVLQDGFVFNDTIVNNIALPADSTEIDWERVIYATRMANLLEYVNSLPLGFQTKIGEDGRGLSQGQKQRLLIARLVYKDPEIIIFDEATNALDAKNESQIVRNLNTFFKDKTVIIVAHRLSTVVDADQIVVLENGNIAELGTHDELVGRRGIYYDLIRNQLELGN